MNLRTIICTSLLFGSLAACGTEPPVVVEPEDTLFPLAVGNRWTYRITSSTGGVDVKTQTVTGTASVDGMTAFRLETDRDANKATRSVQMVKDGRLVRVSEDTLDGTVIDNVYRYQPYGLRIDSNFRTVGDVYQDTHEKQRLDATGAVVEIFTNRHTFTVEATNDPVTVPAGTIECLRVRRDEEGGPTKTFWYAVGLGKVKETGGQTEELVRAELASD